MNEDEIKKALRSYKFSEVEIAKAIEYYNHAASNNLPYPLYYAIARLTV